MGTVRISSSLPKEPTTNGLMAHAAELLRRPGDQRVIIAVVDAAQIVDDRRKGMRIPVVGILSVEMLDEHGAGQARALMEVARDRRESGSQLSFDIRTASGVHTSRDE